MPSSSHLHTRLKTAKGRKPSSIRWLQRQLNDPYVEEAKKQGYRGRAAFKIIELDDQFHFFKQGACIVDLGCAPGGWTQVAVQRTLSTNARPNIFGIDILPTKSIEGAVLLQMDFTDNNASKALKDLMPGSGADVVMSDMAANTTGITSIDHLRTMHLIEIAYDFACQVLKPKGWFIAKIFAGGTDSSLLKNMKQNFALVKHIKPSASRKQSVEYYVVAKGFKCTLKK